MPTYVYKFIDTGETIEVQQAFTDDALTHATHPGDGREPEGQEGLHSGGRDLQGRRVLQDRQPRREVEVVVDLEHDVERVLVDDHVRRLGQQFDPASNPRRQRLPPAAIERPLRILDASSIASARSAALAYSTSRMTPLSGEPTISGMIRTKWPLATMLVTMFW